MTITQTQLLEWVKDGNIETLNEYFSTQLKLSQQKVLAFFKMVDDQLRNVIHWAAYLGQFELLNWWFSEFPGMIDLNIGDMHGYTALDLATIRGYSDEFDPDTQDRTVRLMVSHGAQIASQNLEKPNALHWAYYYGNKDLIEFLISKNFQLQMDRDTSGNFPVDYLFLENRPPNYQVSYKTLFQDTITRYVSTTNPGHKFKDVDKLNKKRTIAPTFVREQVSNPIIKVEVSPESEPSKNELPNSNISNYHKSQTSNSFISKHNRTTIKRNPSQQNLFKTSGKAQCQKILSKMVQDDDVPLYDSEKELHEPEEEKIPEIRAAPNLNNHNNSKLLSEQAPEEQFQIIRLGTIGNINEDQGNQANNSKNIISSQVPTQRLDIPKQVKTPSGRTPGKRHHHHQQSQDGQAPALRSGLRRQTMKEINKYIIRGSKSNLDIEQLFEHRLMYWSARLGYTDFFVYFLKKGCSPFFIIFQGFNCLHIAAYKGKHRILKTIIESDYDYIENVDLLKDGNMIGNARIPFDKEANMNLLTEHNPSNALHLAIEQENYHCMKTLIEHGVSVNIVNHRCLKPFELTYNQRILDFYRENIMKDQKAQAFTDMGYWYVIQTKGLTSVEQDIVFIQLQNIRQTFRERGWLFEFLIFNVPNLDKLELYKDPIHCKRVKPIFHYYVIKLSPDTIYQLADLQGILCYNFKTKHICQFKYDNHMFFEFPKDLQVQSLIINTLNDEFDVDKFVLEKLIIHHFPLEDSAKCEKISQFWREQQNNCIRDSIRLETQQVALRPLHAIASYYGPVIAWYIALNVQIIGWLMLPSLIGAGIGIYIVVEKDLNSPVIPFYALFMTLWSTLFMEKWKNRESELKFCWDMHKFKQQEPQRVMYTGQYVINEATSKIEIYDYFTTFKRRSIAELPIITVGILIIVFSFYGFLLWQQSVEAEDPENVYMPIVISSLNGASMTVFCELYKRICRSLVTWENHRYESEQEYSYVLKVFLFEFLISYVSIVYQIIFGQQTAEKITTAVASIIITRGVISNVMSNLLPYLLYGQIQRSFQNKFQVFKSIFRKASSDQSRALPRITNQNFVSEKLSTDLQLEFLTQLEQSRIKQPQKILYDEYTNIAIQFGYTTMFAPAFPAAPLFFMINCYLNLRFSIYNYQKVMKRERAQAADSIGIWLQIFEIMNYSATFMNCIVIFTVNKEQFSGLIGQSDPLVMIFVLAAIEHILLLLKYILDVSIPDCPYWVEKEMRKYEFLESKAEQPDAESKKIV